jgi:hypothetical protein
MDITAYISNLSFSHFIELLNAVKPLKRAFCDMDNAVMEAYGWGFDFAQPPVTE